jgi:hypothetical protein
MEHKDAKKPESQTPWEPFNPDGEHLSDAELSEPVGVKTGHISKCQTENVCVKTNIVGAQMKSFADLISPLRAKISHFAKARIEKCKNMAWYARIYCAAFLLSFIYIVSVLAWKDVKAFELLTWVSMSLFAIGFILSSWSYVRCLWRTTLGKAVIVVFHAIILVIAEGMSNIFVAAALALPPQDFAVTVNLFTLIFYVPVWAAGGAFVLLGPFLVSALVVTIGSTLSLIVDTWADYSKFLKVIKDKLHKNITKFSGHVVGIAVISIFLTNSFGFVIQNQKYLFPYARLLAYAFDYQNISAYPCIQKGSRVRLHENGVISIASGPKNLSDIFAGIPVTIQVRNYESCPSIEK